MDFTQDQARKRVGVSVETLRHWRKTIPYLSLRTGKAARFTFTEVVGLAVTNELVNTFGIHIVTLSAVVNKIFPLFADAVPAVLDNGMVILSANEATLFDTRSQATGFLAQSAVVIPLAPLVAGIRRQIFPLAAAPQPSALRFPPESVRRQA
jgi:hypothetical protein